jgi:hypothetical protein
MKITPSLLLIILFVSCASGKEMTFIGSTPANHVVRSFLGIPFSDSVDFIRWKVTLQNDKYTLSCNYGIGKPNRNGFMNGGSSVELKGDLRKEKNSYYFQRGNKTLKMVELNPNLLHLLNEDNSLLVGNDGWSYTLNVEKPSNTDRINITSKQAAFKDSMAFEGRTPCGVPGIIAPGRECYKLKWYIVFYSNGKKNEPGVFKILGTPWRKEGGKAGSWKIITGKNGRIIYQMNDEKGNAFIYLLKLDENILAFTDNQGRLLVGDEDFSYTLNRTW